MKFNIMTNLYKRYGENPGGMLNVTGTIGWILSCIAQVGAIITNDKYTKKDKAFLIPQELADGAVNIFSFFILTSSVKHVASKLVSMGKISNKAITNFLKKNNLTDRIGKIDFDIEKLPNFNEIKPEYKAFKNGTDIMASVIGSVISCNIVTPIARNQIANHHSKFLRKAMTQVENENQAQKPMNQYDYYRNTMNAYIKNSGNIKV